MSGGLQLAREALTATLTALSLPGVTVFGFEPPTLPRGATVTVASAGVTATEWLLTIRVYVNGLQPADAQNLLDDTVILIENGLTAPRSDWLFEYDDERQTFRATTTVQVGREDF